MDEFNREYFPKLNGLPNMTMESTALKLMEEAGELAQAISKFRGLNGEKDIMEESEVVEKIVSELMDCMQVCASMSYILEHNYNINMESKFEQHLKKLITRGYLIPKEFTVFDNDEFGLPTCAKEYDTLGVYQLARLMFTNFTHVDNKKSFIIWIDNELSKPTHTKGYKAYISQVKLVIQKQIKK